MVLFYSTNRSVVRSQISLWFLASSPCSNSTRTTKRVANVGQLPFFHPKSPFILEDGEKVSDWTYIQFLRGGKEKRIGETLNYSTSLRVLFKSW